MADERPAKRPKWAEELVIKMRQHREYDRDGQPKSQPISLLPADDDSTGYIIEMVQIPSTPIILPTETRNPYYIVGFTDQPDHVRLAIRADQIYDFVSPRKVEDWNFKEYDRKERERDAKEAEAAKAAAEERRRAPSGKRPGRTRKHFPAPASVLKPEVLEENVLAREKASIQPSLSTPQKPRALRPLTDLDEEDTGFSEAYDDDEVMDMQDGAGQPQGAAGPSTLSMASSGPVAPESGFSSEMDLDNDMEPVDNGMGQSSGTHRAHQSLKSTVARHAIAPFPRPARHIPRSPKSRATGRGPGRWPKGSKKSDLRDNVQSWRGPPPSQVADRNRQEQAQAGHQSASTSLSGNMAGSSRPTVMTPNDIGYDAYIASMSNPLVRGILASPRPSTPATPQAQAPHHADSPNTPRSGMVSHTQAAAANGTSAAGATHGTPVPATSKTTTGTEQHIDNEQEERNPEADDATEDAAEDDEEEDFEPQYKVQRLEGHRSREISGERVRQFLVRWEGDWPPDENPTWEDEDNISPVLVKAYLKEAKAQKAMKQQLKKAGGASAATPGAAKGKTPAKSAAAAAAVATANAAAIAGATGTPTPSGTPKPATTTTGGKNQKNTLSSWLKPSATPTTTAADKGKGKEAKVQEQQNNDDDDDESSEDGDEEYIPAQPRRRSQLY